MCVFCNKMQKNSTLSRHIKLIHKNETRVENALVMTKKDMFCEFNKFKREGILEYNKEQASSVNPIYQREKVANVWTDAICCGNCQSFIGERGFSRHVKNCQPSDCKLTVSVPAHLLQVPTGMELNDDFKINILSKFRNNLVGTLCITDETILKVGQIFYSKVKRKADKAIQVRKTVRMEMRRLGNLCIIFKQEKNLLIKYANSMDMFIRPNFMQLRNAIDLYSTSTVGNLKPGLKQNLFYLFKQAAKAIKALKLAECDDASAEEIGKFVEIFELWSHNIFGESQYELNKRRQINLRRPGKLPDEEDIMLVHDYVISKMKTLTADIFTICTTSEYVLLRDSACSRLTLLNGRRGGEPAYLTISEWKDAIGNKWIDQQRIDELDELDQQLVSKLKVTYLTGKGNNHLVPLLLPEDTLPALEKLANKEVREQAGIKADNNYLFASTRNSDDHVSGWHSLHNICAALPLKNAANIKSTSNRHRISTLFAAMEMSKAERAYFYKHMGHTESINEQVYQAPLTLMEITKIGKSLLDIDKGMTVIAIFEVLYK